MTTRHLRPIVIAGAFAALLFQPALSAQRGRGSQSENLRQASQALRSGDEAGALAAVRRELQANPTSTQAGNLLDTLGQHAEARAVFQRQFDTSTDPAVKAAANRSIAMSYAFENNCAKTMEYEEKVIAYWKTREQAEPQNAFYQEGEMANEGARVCAESGDFDVAEKYYRLGSELGLKEPGNETHPRSLWDFRLAHALGRLAARRGNKAEAERQVAAARQALDSDPKMAEQQERFFPYLVGYVALYTGDLKTAETELVKATSLQGNQNDPFMNCLLAMTYEKLGDQAKARELYQKAFDAATAHNPPAAFVRTFARTKLR